MKLDLSRVPVGHMYLRRWPTAEGHSVAINERVSEGATRSLINGRGDPINTMQPIDFDGWAVGTAVIPIPAEHQDRARMLLVHGCYAKVIALGEGFSG